MQRSTLKKLVPFVAAIVVAACSSTDAAFEPVGPHREAAPAGTFGEAEQGEATPTVAVAEPAAPEEAPADYDSFRGGPSAGDGNEARVRRESQAVAATPPPHPQRIPGGGGGPGLTTPGASHPLPQNGVVASTFVGGSGVQARLEDLLDRGVVVDGENVRIGAFEDRERLPYPVPSEEAVGLYAELERGRVHASGDTVHLQIALVGREGERPARPRMDVRLVLDRSGSMQGEKWQQAIAAAHALVDRLEPEDTFGLISYADYAAMDHRPARVGDRQRIHRAIDALAPGGGTNIGAALDLAASHAPVRRDPSDVALVVLVSDGRATVGQTSAPELGRTARSMFDRSGVLTTAIGLGTDFDEQTMLTIAREGSGSYHFVRRPSDVAGILTEELEERAQAVAQALRVRVELGDGVVARRIYGSRLLSEEEHAAVRTTEVATDRRLAAELGITQDRQNEEERGIRMHLPTFRRGDQHVILMELEVPPGASVGPVARVTLDYKDLVRGQNERVTRDVTAERSPDRNAVTASTQRLVKRTVLAFQAGEALQIAADSLGAGDASEAAELLAERRRVLEAAADLWRDDSLRRDAAMLARYERVVRSAYPGWDDGQQRTLVMAMNHFGDERMQ